MSNQALLNQVKDPELEDQAWDQRRATLVAILQDPHHLVLAAPEQMFFQILNSGAFAEEGPLVDACLVSAPA